MVKPGGTGRPRLAISARLAPLPPSRSRMLARPSARTSPKPLTSLPFCAAPFCAAVIFGAAFRTAGFFASGLRAAAFFFKATFFAAVLADWKGGGEGKDET